MSLIVDMLVLFLFSVIWMSTVFAVEEQASLPVLSVGDFNLTRDNFTDTVFVNNKAYTLVGVSSLSNCDNCAKAEPEYLKLLEVLKRRRTPFARVNVDEFPQIADEYSITELPALLLFRKHSQFPRIYPGSHQFYPMEQYFKKFIEGPYEHLYNIEDVNKFLNLKNECKHCEDFAMVLAFFGSPRPENFFDYLEEFMFMSERFSYDEDIFMAAVGHGHIVDHFIEQKVIDEPFTMIVIGKDKTIHKAKMVDIFLTIGGEDEDHWVRRKILPFVGEVKESNYESYEKEMVPILLLFIDPSQPDEDNDVIIKEFKSAAEECSSDILYGFVKGKSYPSLPDVEIENLPSVAFITDSTIEKPMNMPLTKENIVNYCKNIIKVSKKTYHEEL